MTRRVQVHPVAADWLKRARGSERSIVVAALNRLPVDSDRLEADPKLRLERDLVPLRKVRLGALRIVIGFTEDCVLVLAFGVRLAGQKPDFYDRLSERVGAGDYTEELQLLREYERKKSGEGATS